MIILLRRCRRVFPGNAAISWACSSGVRTSGIGLFNRFSLSHPSWDFDVIRFPWVIWGSVEAKRLSYTVGAFWYFYIAGVAYKILFSFPRRPPVPFAGIVA